MAEHLLIESDGPWLHVTLNRPRRGNQVTPRMMLALGRLGEHVADAHKAVFVRGHGRDFCIGREPKPIPGGSVASAHDAHASVMTPILAVYRAVRACPVPVIAAVQGRAHGFGCGFAGVCDVVVSTDDASFALPEMRNGIPPTLVMSALADVSRKTLVDMVFSSAPIDAASAMAAGIVSRIVAAGDLEHALAALRDTLSVYDHAQIRYVKGFADKPGRLDVSTLSELAGYTLATAFTRRR